MDLSKYDLGSGEEEDNVDLSNTSESMQHILHSPYTENICITINQKVECVPYNDWLMLYTVASI